MPIVDTIGEFKSRAYTFAIVFAGLSDMETEQVAIE